MTRRKFLLESGLAACAIPARSLLAETTATAAYARTPSGRLRGEATGGVRVFRGVPFAAPPTGPLRFLPTEKILPWKHERDATRFAAAPMQPGLPRQPQSEDCLYLNVWTPERAGPHPVFVWIHGGGFTGGLASEPLYDGTEFAREGIVCVTVEYRLGVFGFLDWEPMLGRQYTGTANNGIRDLMMALTWIQENIGALGGDPDRVTIGGESAGAKLTDTLMGIPSAQPLFQQMISESGGAERIWNRTASRTIAQAYAEVWQRHSGEAPSRWKTADAAGLIQAQQSFMRTWPQHFPLRPEIDGTLIPRLPIETIAGGSTRGKRLLIGTNREESALFIGPHPAADPTARQLGNISLSKFDPVYARYGQIYPEMSAEQRRIRAVTAEEYWVPSMRVAEAHLRGGGTAYVYELEFVETSGGLRGNAYHSLDVGMVWDHPHVRVTDAAAEIALGRQMHAAWSAFIRGEAPAAPGLPAWPQYNERSRETMIFGANASATSHVEPAPQASELHLWKGKL